MGKTRMLPRGKKPVLVPVERTPEELKKIVEGITEPKASVKCLSRPNANKIGNKPTKIGVKAWKVRQSKR